MSPGRRPTATVLKIIRGSVNPGRFRDDRPKIAAPPCLPPGAVLTPDEQKMWSWLLEHVYLPGIHSTADGAIFTKICKLWVRACQADEKCERHGLVMKGAKGKPEVQPYARLSRDLWHQLGVALSEAGCSPGGRAKIAGPRGQGALGEGSSWDEID